MATRVAPPDAIVQHTGDAAVPGAERAEVRNWLKGQGLAHATLLAKGYQSWVYLCPTPYGKIVIKRAHPAPVMRWLGRLALRHEQRIYERLTGIPGVPMSYGMLDNENLALEHIDGESLRQVQHRLADRDQFFALLRQTIDAMHDAGVAHGDLKRKYNILVGPDERPYVIDFGVARVWKQPDSRFGRWLYLWLRQTDDNAWVKMKYQRQLDALSDEDRIIYRPLLLERIARAIRIALRTITLRKLRKRIRNRRAARP